MKILLYSAYFAPSVGGVESHFMDLARGLAQRGPDAGNAAGETPEVTVVTRTPAPGMDDRALPFRVVRRPTLVSLARYIRHADVIHLAGPALAPLLLAVLFRRPVVLEHHGYQAACPNGLLLHEPDKVVCPGHFLARRYPRCLQCNAATYGWQKSLRMLLLGFPRRSLARRATTNVSITDHVQKRINLPRSRVIYYGIRPADSPSEAGGEDVAFSHSNALTFAFVGRLVSEKGLPVLFQAARAIHAEGRPFRLKIIGDGPERSRLEEMAAGLGLAERVLFTGSLQGQALERALADVAAVIMPSIWEETAGLSAIEQMMRGRVVIASDIGGLSEVVGDAGMKFAPGDIAELARCLRRALDEPRLRCALGARARERASQRFSLNRMVEEFMNLYREVALRKPGERHAAGSGGWRAFLRAGGAEMTTPGEGTSRVARQKDVGLPSEGKIR